MTIEAAPPRPGRPKSPAKAAAIRRAAGELFLAHGLRNTSMDAVANAAGVSKQTVYSHFRGKDDLFRAVIAAKVADHQLDAAAMPAEAELRAALVTIGERYLELIFDPEVVAMFRLVIAESHAYPKVAELFYESGPARTLGAVQRFLGERAARGELHVDDPVQAGAQLLNLVRGECHLHLLLNLRGSVSGTERRERAEHAADQFLKLYGA